MSQPPVDPAGLTSSADTSPTEPVPAFVPMPSPQGAQVSPPPTAPLATDPAFTPVEQAFTPVDPEPGPGQASALPPAPASPGGRSGSGPSKPLLIAIGAIVLVGVAAVALATGLTIVPASDTTGGVSNRQERQGGGAQDGRQGQGQDREDKGQGNGGPQGRGNGGHGRGNGDQVQGQLPGGGRMDQNGQGPMRGGMVPGSSFDPSGNGALPGSGLGRQGMGGLGLSGTVTAVTPDSVTIKTEAGMTVTIGLDDGTTYHQQAPAASSDVTTGTKIQVQLDGGVRPSRDASGNINVGTADDITVVP